jgi:chromosomal replication initiator protein
MHLEVRARIGDVLNVIVSTEDRSTIESRIRAELANRIGASRFEVWFGEGVRLSVDDRSLVVHVPSRFFREWIERHHSTALAEAAEAILGHAVILAFEVDGEIAPTRSRTESRATAAPDAPPTLRVVSEPLPIEKSLPRNRSWPRPTKRLENFVPGPGTRLALAAATEMAETLGSSFNPLFLHGGIGLGKSHLLEGISNEVRERNPNGRVIHVTAEAFTNAFLDALRAAALPAFRSRHRAAQLFVVDDVHFIAAKRATHDEFLHTFDALIGSGAAVVLSADQHPRRIPKLSDELATRFLGGMVVKLEAPDPATRRAVLRSKAIARGVDLPEGVVEYVADHLQGSVRELEGALASLIAHATLAGRRIDLSLAKTALRDTIRYVAQAVGLKDVERVICSLFALDLESLHSDRRVQSITHPRMLAMYVARRHTGASYAEIGRFFGDRNHSTVIAAERKVRAWLEAERRHALFHGFETIEDALAAVERELGV